MKLIIIGFKTKVDLSYLVHHPCLTNAASEANRDEVTCFEDT